jgi:hypothetical protein
MFNSLSNQGNVNQNCIDTSHMAVIKKATNAGEDAKGKRNSYSLLVGV